MFSRMAFGDLWGGVVMSTPIMPKRNQHVKTFLSELTLTLAVKSVNFIFGFCFYFF